MDTKHFAVFLLALTLSGQAEAKSVLNCKAMDAAISANEDFVEVALLANPAGLAEAHQAVIDSLSAVEKSLSKDHLQQARLSVDKLNQAVAANDMSAAALAAMDSYEVLVGAFEPNLPTTRDVAMLDHAGFKVHALLAAKTIDWISIGDTLTTTKVDIKAASQQLDDKALQDMLATLAKGLADAYQAKDKAWEHNTAQLLLDSVDLIERTVKNPSKQACP